MIGQNQKSYFCSSVKEINLFCGMAVIVQCVCVCVCVFVLLYLCGLTLNIPPFLRGHFTYEGILPDPHKEKENARRNSVCERESACLGVLKWSGEE